VSQEQIRPLYLDGISGIFQERVTRKKVQIAVKLLEKYGYERTEGNIHKVTKQGYFTIRHHMPTRVLEARERRRLESIPPERLAEVIPLRRNDDQGQTEGNKK
jgi:hypothetical protein